MFLNKSWWHITNQKTLSFRHGDLSNWNNSWHSRRCTDPWTSKTTFDAQCCAPGAWQTKIQAGPQFPTLWTWRDSLMVRFIYGWQRIIIAEIIHHHSSKWIGLLLTPFIAFVSPSSHRRVAQCRWLNLSRSSLSRSLSSGFVCFPQTSALRRCLSEHKVLLELVGGHLDLGNFTGDFRKKNVDVFVLSVALLQSRVPQQYHLLLLCASRYSCGCPEIYHACESMSP